jgi:hypothetical protein
MSADIGRTIHCCVDVRGLLSKSKRELAKWRGAFVMAGGKTSAANTVEEIREVLFDQLAMGREVLPVGKPCPGWDYKKGCPGHAAGEEGGR